MSHGYRDVKEAAEDTLQYIWGAWVVAGIAAIALAIWTENVPILNVITEYFAVYGWIPSTIIAFWLSFRVHEGVERARREVKDQYDIDV